MENIEQTSKNNFKGLFKYISTVVSWTVFVLLLIIGVLLIYYFISLRLYATRGEKYEPKFSVYTIVSQSMEPTINVYDVIVNTRVDKPTDIKTNDVITYISTWQVTYGMTITHRVIGTKTLDDGSTCYITRGDNNTQEDQACVKESNVIGVVKAVIPGLGRVQSFLSSSMGWLLLIIIPALYIIVKDIIKLFKLAKDNKEEKTIEVNSEEKEKIEEIEKKDSKKSKNLPKNKKLEQAYKDLLKVKKK